jgi:hypothetical protein
LKNITKVKILYRGSRDGWYPKDFKSRCDKKSPSLTLFQIDNGDCIGGFTTVEWSSEFNRDVFKKDTKAFLFNLNKNLSFPCLKPQEAIMCYSETGPYFGKSELFV